ncbi:MAG: ribosome small subunit-dependent GTPase A [Acidimicrobiia bacterium]|nr:ribosome small subunit-dependent GTPase A [Acidimicrobiia bacterium]MDH3397148.1 ribosome small subunit-dependent GTPase A [Acidimicrobiia bacterium]
MDTADNFARPDIQSLLAYGWNERVAALFTTFPNRIPGRVVRVDRMRYLVATPHGQTDAFKGPHDEGSETGTPATGDWVALAAGSDQRASVAAILPRHSVIKRLDPSVAGARPEEQVLVANLDVAFVVHALDRPAQLSRLERTLVMAWESGAIPALVLTKADLMDGGPQGHAVREAVEAVRQIAPGVEVIAASNVTGFGLDEVLGLMSPGMTGALIGESGSGKSTLINNLLDEQLQSTGPTRSGDGQGRHTTTSRELIVIPGRGILIDTPGLRAIGLWSGRDGLAQAFRDIENLAADCRFADCRHETEPGCALQAAVNRGDLDPRRIDSHRKMEAEVAQQEHQLSVRMSRANQRTAGRRSRPIRNDDVEE